ncbi:PPOX class F420-dependent oxidoreductase [Rhodococcus sp. D2-41]|uniref:pyridoxamine 5'-phosphate oxidase family protein n=1 Tax=Speluncibacter jeojiensis TaxID=2710754 RepID=UPI00240EAA82|nr:PPOX class F420-dependent oxidoreductase [Rhodococcus sp. D2-41]MDG3011074.1 PPOX class F420-dependent oxidoreductase [Rhodococcus sp. D2-41]
MGVKQRDQIKMSEAEIAEFLDHSRTATIATVGPSGTPHLIAMWYAVIDGRIWFETKAKAQKVLNLRRDGRITAMVEAGQTYDTLRGVSIEGRATIVEDPDALWALGVQIWERYHGAYTEQMRPAVEMMLHKRVAVRIDPDRVRSWDHRKLGLPEMPVAGSTAQYL